MRSRAPPVADAASRSTRSGRKERASEQREVLFGHRKAVGANTPWLPLERICAQYGFGFFAPEKSKSVSSTAKRQRGLQRGKPGPPLLCFASFCTHKRNAPAASRTGFAPCKINAPPLGDHNLGLIFLLPTFYHRKVGPRRVGVLTKPCTRLRPAEGEMKLWHNLCHQSLRLISFATSLYTREAFAVRRLQTGLRRVGEMK